VASLLGGFDHPAQRVAEHWVRTAPIPVASLRQTTGESAWWQAVSIMDAARSMFTRHASGHNPRPSGADRYRQRVLHKFAFSTADDQAFRCVGCGRCVALCPAGVDIVDAARAVVAAVQGEARNAGG
jgi:formate hydrogenlyase subunit 6/NADH:ubiquinone oxidoreductase subunit I